MYSYHACDHACELSCVDNIGMDHVLDHVSELGLGHGLRWTYMVQLPSS